MKHITLILIFVLSICISGVTWAGICERCYEKIADDKQLCVECELSTSNRLADLKSREVRIIKVITSERKIYKNTLEELIQYYMDTGNNLRLKKARKELKELNKVPQLEYLKASTKTINIYPSRNIEEANILFEDGKSYKNTRSIINKKSKLIYAEIRFKKILNDYPESNKADDAAYELAEIYDSNYFKDYEGAAFYYVKCYNINENTDRPARFRAACVYDKHLKDFKEAVKNYNEVLRNSKDGAHLITAEKRLNQLTKEGY